MTLKQSNDAERSNFADLVLNFINPKFESEEEFHASKYVLLEFAAKCELTAREFLYALELTADGKLYDGEQKVKLFREIDRLKLGEIKAAYIEHKRHDKLYEIGTAKIKAYLNPPPKISKEQAQHERRENWERLKSAAAAGEPCEFAFLFYDYIVSKGALKNFLNNPEAIQYRMHKKMKEILQAEKQKKKPILFNRHEIEQLENELNGKQIASTYISRLKLKNIATVQLKNDLVYEFIKKRYNGQKIN